MMMMWWWAKSNWLSLNSLKAGSYPQWLSRTQTACKLLNRLPSSQPECQQRLTWMHSHREPTDLRIYSTVYQTYSREASGLSVWLTTQPRLHSQRLQWEITFLVNLIYIFFSFFFFKWPYLSLKKMRHLGTNGGGNVSCLFFKLSVHIDVGHRFCHRGHWASVV